ncbi:MAG: hypothetical protein PHH93_12615, partial [Prolixibacteraceae bacterium]|nr:hypothetical protein [Prolixibacteraceae bacterium]
MIDALKGIFGPKCSAIIVNRELHQPINVPTKQLKFCEAVNLSFDALVRVTGENLACLGARRSFGFNF